MKRLAVVVILAAVVIWYLRHRGSSSSTQPPPAAGAPAGLSSHAAPSATPTATGSAKPPTHATQITPEQRRDIAQRIANAHAVHSVPAPPSLPAASPTLDPTDTEGFKTTLRSAMREVIPMITDCYANAGSSVGAEITVNAHLVLTGDHDIGTLIDAGQLTDPAGGTFDKGFDDCMRATLQSIELPPLAEGDSVNVTYPFVFRRN